MLEKTNRQKTPNFHLTELGLDKNAKNGLVVVREICVYGIAYYVPGAIQRSFSCLCEADRKVSDQRSHLLILSIEVKRDGEPSTHK